MSSGDRYRMERKRGLQKLQEELRCSTTNQLTRYTYPCYSEPIPCMDDFSELVVKAGKAILAPSNDDIDGLNSTTLPEKEREYLSANFTKNEGGAADPGDMSNLGLKTILRVWLSTGSLSIARFSTSWRSSCYCGIWMQGRGCVTVHALS